MPAMLFLGVILSAIGVVLLKLQDMQLITGIGWRAVPGFTAALVLLLTIVRVVQWAGRVKKLSVGAASLSVTRLVAIWLWGAIVLLGIVPWCVGLIWIVIDSFL